MNKMLAVFAVAALAAISIHAQGCDPTPAGLVGWWRAGGNVNDSAGANTGILINGANFAPGKVGQAFSFNGTNQYVGIPQSPSLNTFSNQMTIEFWMYANPGNSMATFQGLVTSDYYGIEISTGLGFGANGINWYVNTRNGAYLISNVNGGGIPVSAGQWHHIAGTYDGSKLQLYVDGQPKGNPEPASGTILPMLINSFVAIGSDDGRTSCGCTGRYFGGLIDEVSIYNRALSSNEIAAIYQAGSAGKCSGLTAPFILFQPTNQTVTAGGTAIFSVTAGGTAPLFYQWSLNGTNLLGATNAVLMLNNVRTGQAGYYAVRVANAAGSTNSASARLMVLGATCDPAPPGLVAWWKGDGNGSDSVGADNATVPSGVTYVPGEVGLGFNLNGNTNRILAPDEPQLNFGPNKDFSIEAWIQPLSNLGNYTDLSGEVMTVISKRYSPNAYTALGYELYLGGGRLCFQMIDSLNHGGNFYNLGAESDLRDGKFHHVAVTVQRNSTTGLKFYVDGQLIATFDPTAVSGDLSNTSPLRIGNHPDPGIQAFYHGIIDEVSLYNRALSAAEILAIYNAGSAGKCSGLTAPFILFQPTNQTVTAGGTAIFSVTAGGTAPLFYQWGLNGTNLLGATNAVLMLNNVQPGQAGYYAVRVANAAGSTNSASARLMVYLPLRSVFRGNGLYLTWPANPPGFVLETAPDLSSGHWIRVAAATNQIGGQCFFPLAGGSNAYYRLHFIGP